MSPRLLQVPTSSKSKSSRTKIRPSPQPTITPITKFISRIWTHRVNSRAIENRCHMGRAVAALNSFPSDECKATTIARPSNNEWEVCDDSSLRIRAVKHRRRKSRWRKASRKLLGTGVLKAILRRKFLARVAWPWYGWGWKMGEVLQWSSSHEQMQTNLTRQPMLSCKWQICCKNTRQRKKNRTFAWCKTLLMTRRIYGWSMN